MPGTRLGSTRAGRAPLFAICCTLMAAFACRPSATTPTQPERKAPPEAEAPPPSPDVPPRTLDCTLEAPRLSTDRCDTDADCGVSQPCHAPACVGIEKANPPTSETVCTMNVVCDSADVNRCGCFDGVCALIPRGMGET